MSKDKYATMFSPQMKVIVFIIPQIFSAMRAVMKIGEYSRIFPSFSQEILGHVMCLDQSLASENISWVICKIIDITCVCIRYNVHSYWPIVPGIILS